MIRTILLLSLSLLSLVVAQPDPNCICPPGQLKQGPKCIPCPPGTFGDPSTTTCEPCPPNTASMEAGAYACTPCGEGSIPEQNSANKCVCKPGYIEEVSHPGVAICQRLDCPPGQYLEQYAGADSSCNLCSPGTYKPEGAASCMKCPEGTASQYGATKCIGCPKGKFVLQSGECGVCPAGEQPNWSVLQCEKCPPGSFKQWGGLGPCKVCPTGSVSLEGATECLACQQGMVPIGSTCGKCPPGKFYNAFTWTCDDCTRGTYMDSVGVLETCKTCPMGGDALPGASECTVCGEGMKMMANGKCEGCKEGWFYDSEDMKCSMCTVNYFSKGGGVEVCTPCAPGMYAGNGANKCFACAKGKAWMVKSGSCGVCERGFYYDVYKAECMKCSKSMGIRPESGVKRFCKQCPPGEEGDAMGTSCVPIREVTYCPVG